MQNRNSRVTQAIRDVSRSQEAVETLPSSFSPTIQLSADVNPRLNAVSSISRNLASGAFTVPTGKRFMLTHMALSASHAATDTGSSLFIQGVTDDGATRPLLTIRFTNGAVENQAVSSPVTPPIPLTGSLSCSATNIANYACIVHGYLEDI